MNSFTGIVQVFFRTFYTRYHMVTAPILLFVKYAKCRENHQTTEAVAMR